MTDHTSEAKRGTVLRLGGLMTCVALGLGGCTSTPVPVQAPPSATPSPSASPTVRSSPPFPGIGADEIMGRIATRWGLVVERNSARGTARVEAKKVLPEGFTLWVRVAVDENGLAQRVECMAENSVSPQVAATLAECAEIAFNGTATPRPRAWVAEQFALAADPAGPKESIGTLADSGFDLRLVARVPSSILTITRTAP
ncbi:hypothetical protein [Kitasatospora sp. NPDC002040]|uniref:hypothetical protein n=1 Tax=Kitasatospora sp. NPDC002040 TaxID=3154661 RepID=UPI0033297912